MSDIISYMKYTNLSVCRKVERTTYIVRTYVHYLQNGTRTQQRNKAKEIEKNEELFKDEDG